MTNIIDFPVNQMFEREVFDRSQDVAKDIASNCVVNAETIEEYVLTLSMASGFALSYLKENHPELWDEIGEYLEVVAVGGGLK